MKITFIFSLVALICVFELSVAYDGKQDWGYVKVRNQAHMFWWLYYAQSTSTPSTSLPLVIWLQGGPGASSTGFGNFEEIGPQDVNLRERKTSWIKAANLLFIDNPVGTGYSYVENYNALTTDNSQIASDLVVLLQNVFKKLPALQQLPLYIFSESYGGKMTATFAVHLHKAIQSKKIQCNFKGVALGDSWISPIDSVATWGPYLKTMSLVDSQGEKQINSYADRIRTALANKQGRQATNLWSSAEGAVSSLTDNVNFYNILDKYSSEDSIQFKNVVYKTARSNNYTNSLYRFLSPFYKDSLYTLMNGQIHQKLGIPSNVRWGAQSGQVFNALSDDFMLPVTNDVEFLLNSTNLKVVVFTGQLDLIVDTLGTVQWVDALNWSGSKSFYQANKTPLRSSYGHTVGFVKNSKNLHFYWILNAGHMIPSDQGEAALLMLKSILNH